MLNPLNFFSKFVKSSNQKELDRISKIVEKVNSYEASIKEMDDDDAMMMIPESEEYPNDHVALVVQSGWTIGDRVLRAAKVGIAKKQ